MAENTFALNVAGTSNTLSVNWPEIVLVTKQTGGAISEAPKLPRDIKIVIILITCMRRGVASPKLSTSRQSCHEIAARIKCSARQQKWHQSDAARALRRRGGNKCGIIAAAPPTDK